MTMDRLWGRSVWLWYLQPALLAAFLLLLVLSQTVSGRAFAVMLIVAQTFVVWSLYASWLRSERLRIAADLGFPRE